MKIINLTAGEFMRVCIVGVMGAFGRKHLEAINNIDYAIVTSIVGTDLDDLQLFANVNNIEHFTTSLAESLVREVVDCVILATPTHLHASQVIQCLIAGKPVQTEIPMADNIADVYRMLEVQKQTGVIAMAGHTRRFNPSHQWINKKINKGELTLLKMDVQTYFLRRSNLNAQGETRNWTDHLLWHHACHSVDLFQYQTGQEISHSFGLQGNPHPELGIAMDMSLGLKVASGSICTISLSFNNDGPFGSFFRYICQEGTYIARYDELVDGYGNMIDLSGISAILNGIELQDREFFESILEKREPNSSIQQCCSSMQTLERIDACMLD